jgi:hypothetical protein
VTGRSGIYSTTTSTLVVVFSNIAIGADVLGYAFSFFEAAIADFFYVAGIGVGCYFGGYQGCLDGAKGAALIDYHIAGTSPLSFFENILGGIALGATALADGFAGNTDLLDPSNPRIGKDTLVSARNFAAGFVPEANFDLAVSASQLKYDIDRNQGLKPGGSISLSDPIGLGFQLLFGDWW